MAFRTEMRPTWIAAVLMHQRVLMTSLVLSRAIARVVSATIMFAKPQRRMTVSKTVMKLTLTAVDRMRRRVLTDKAVHSLLIVQAVSAPRTTFAERPLPTMVCKMEMRPT